MTEYTTDTVRSKRCAKSSLLNYVSCRDSTEMRPILAPLSSSENHKPNGYSSLLNANVVVLDSTHTSDTTIKLANSSASFSLISHDPDEVRSGFGENSNVLPAESLRVMLVQIFIPFLIAGFGMVGAGLVLDKVQNWDYFTNVAGVYTVIPPLLGLKGNLEMTLAARLSTLANMGYIDIDSKKSFLSHVGGNMLISQCLASTIGCITSLVAISIDAIETGELKMQQYLLLTSSSVATAALSSFILDAIMVAVILTSRRYGINPDNVATPIAASLGDITTIGLLAGIGSGLHTVIHHIVWLGPIVSFLFLALVPIWIFLASRHAYTAQALKTTFIPVLGAMFISTGAGFILNTAVKTYSDIAVFQPIINGVGGNLVAIQASRIATSLHQVCIMGTLPSSHPSICINPFSVYFGKDSHSRSIRVLMLMVVPGHVIFIYTTSYVSTGRDVLSLAFVAVYLFSAMLQVSILLYVATIITYLVWKLKYDPDNFTIPSLTALGDLLGIGLLFITFIFLQFLESPVEFINMS
uniref:SLC41A/MgtE integral membrane domain-containing protein n=1 Tax=Strigamia maritima TaxID=126957 RepID=T1IJK9_STRMM